MGSGVSNGGIPSAGFLCLQILPPVLCSSACQWACSDCVYASVPYVELNEDSERDPHKAEMLREHFEK